jgi:ankyrin repeat protein
MTYAPILQRHVTHPEAALVRDADGTSHCVKDIFRAAVEGDVECIEANLALGVDINSQGQPAHCWGPRYEKSALFYATPLHYACSYGREAAVKALLQHGARTDIRSASGLSCKEYARRRNYVSILMLLDSHDRQNE